MFDFVRKPFLWDAWERELNEKIGDNERFRLKAIQDMVVYDQLRELSGCKIAEVGGGASRLLGLLAQRNRCFNVEKFEGAGGGPKAEAHIPGVQNVYTFLGECSPRLQSDSFDVVFSISVVEHVPNDHLSAFLEDGIRIMRPGGLWLHAIDLYLEDDPRPQVHERFNAYRSWLDDPALEPIGAVYSGPPKFTCDMATNPDNVMYDWGKTAPALKDFRMRAQSVSLLVGAKKRLSA